MVRSVALVFVLGLMCVSASLAQSPFLQHRRTASRPPPAGGTPSGNVWTVATSNCVGNASTITVPAGSSGDVIIVIIKWEADVGNTTITGLSDAVNGSYTFIGSQIDNVANTSLSMHAARVIATSASSGTLTPTFSAASSFRDWTLLRCQVSGTPAFASVTAQGTGTSISAGPYTTTTVNGLLVELAGPDGSTTHSSKLFGGQTPTVSQVLAGTSAESAWYKHAAQQSSANFTETFGTSRNWVVKVVSATAQ